MTAGEFSGVDPDLLADYVGGALDGTPDEAEVARLVREDPAWRQAYAQLSGAVEAVGKDLAGLGSTAETMPADVADRLSTTLVRLGPVKAGTEPDGHDRPRLRVVPDPDADAGRATAVAVAGGRGSRRIRYRRWSRLAGPVSVAAAVLLATGFGVGRLVGGSEGVTSSDTASSEHSGQAPAVVAPQSADDRPGVPRALQEPSTERVLASGTDYRPDTLVNRIGQIDRQVTDGNRQESHTPSPPSVPMQASAGWSPAPGLGRLADRAALAVCLDAVATEHAQGPVSVGLVDFAAFQGAPALLVVFTDTAGKRWAWITGPACGLPTSGADTRYRVQVG